MTGQSDTHGPRDPVLTDAEREAMEKAREKFMPKPSVQEHPTVADLAALDAKMAYRGGFETGFVAGRGFAAREPSPEPSSGPISQETHPALWAALGERDLLYKGDIPEGFIKGWDARAALAASSPSPDARLDMRPFPMQDGPPIPWFLAEAIHKHLYRYSQSVERVAERGGFGWEEVTALGRKNSSPEQRKACSAEVTEILRSVADTESRPVCPDGGTCHHNCKGRDCFRVECCAPLSGVYVNDEWPEELKS